MPFKDPAAQRAAVARAQAKRRNRDRNTILDHYGRQCFCGEAIDEFLTLDHIDGGGCAERKLLIGSNLRGGADAYKFYIRQGFPTGLRTACFNCQQHKLVTVDWVGTSTLKKTVSSRASYKKARLAALQLLGGKCQCCGEDRPTVLQIDHVGGGGRKKGALRGEKLYRHIVRAVELHQGERAVLLRGLGQHYQVLCSNCNHSKGEDPSGKCWHERLRERANETAFNSWEWPIQTAYTEALITWGEGPTGREHRRILRALIAQLLPIKVRAGAMPPLPE